MPDQEELSRVENTERRSGEQVVESYCGYGVLGWGKSPTAPAEPQAALKGRPARSQRVKARGLALRYIEGLNDARTPVAGFFNSLLEKSFHRLSRSGQDHLLALFDNRTLNEIRMGQHHIKQFIIRNILFR